MFEEIANANLMERDIPAPEAEWGTISTFALSFDGYSHWGSFDQCADVGNRWAKAYAERQALPESLADLRTCLFFEQRRWRHYGWEPDEQAMRYIRALVEATRGSVLAGEVDQGSTYPRRVPGFFTLPPVPLGGTIYLRKSRW